MKIKIKSKEEINKTLNESGCHIDTKGAYFSVYMFAYCGMTLEADPNPCRDYAVSTDCNWTPLGSCRWHKDWYEVIEPDLTDEDLMDIELMGEMLDYFLTN